MGIRILHEKRMMTAVEVMVLGQHNAEYVMSEAQKAGFNSNLKNRGGLESTNAYQVVIDRKNGGKVSEIIDFLESHSQIDCFEHEAERKSD